MAREKKVGVPHLSPDFVWKVTAGTPLQVVEKKEAGKGIASFTSAHDAIYIKARDKAPVIWSLKIKNCAEAAFITIDGDAHHLHVVELKSKLTQAEFAKAKLQLEGMYLSALAVSRIMDITHFSSTTCYVAYSENAMGPDKSADTIFMKTFVGIDNPIGGAEDWFDETINLPLGMIANLRTGQRDQSNNIDFGQV